jgi:hypothetical protein
MYTSVWPGVISGNEDLNFSKKPWSSVLWNIKCMSQYFMEELRFDKQQSLKNSTIFTVHLDICV